MNDKKKDKQIKQTITNEFIKFSAFYTKNIFYFPKLKFMYFIDKYSFFVVHSVWINIKVNKLFNEILINWDFFLNFKGMLLTIWIRAIEYISKNNYTLGFHSKKNLNTTVIDKWS